MGLSPALMRSASSSGAVTRSSLCPALPDRVANSFRASRGMSSTEEKASAQPIAIAAPGYVYESPSYIGRVKSDVSSTWRMMITWEIL